MRKNLRAYAAGLACGGVLLGCSVNHDDATAAGGDSSTGKDSGGDSTTDKGAGGNSSTGKGAGGDPSANGNGGDPSASGGAGVEPGTEEAPPAQNLTCLAIFACSGMCPDDATSDACVEDCIARGGSDAQAESLALAQCYSDNGCADAACLQEFCQAEYDECAAAPDQSGGAPIGTQGPPAGSIPAEYVGTWQYGDTFGSTDDFSFGADGSLTRKLVSTGSFAGCTSSDIEQQDGTAVFEDGTGAFTFYITSAQNIEYRCGVKTTKPGTTGAFQFQVAATRYMRNPIRIYELRNCTSPPGDARDFECSFTYYLQ
jgi:hypothetical protein